MVSDDDELIEIRLHRSRLMLVVGTSVHFLALLAPWFSSLSFLLQLLISSLVVAYARSFYRRYITRTSPDSVLALRYCNDQWLLLTKSGWQRAWTTGTLLVTPWLMAFCFRTEEKKSGLSWVGMGNYQVCLWPDTDKAASLHALRLRLLLKKNRPDGSGYK
ncbi:protein YgfX [Endozoicomonas lisbonensis]|uniref:Toxin CptA n=1 Tax=Endozoicomonas lisbonensis TaxID=3120522 RepID=A0ABV2SM77_9GAMM